jgi:FkbM family methyltransferase
MQVVTGEVVSRSILTFGYSEVAITALMLHVVKTGQTVVDIGTHFGYEALLAYKLVGMHGQVICFEPSPATFAIAQKNFTGFPQIQLHQQAVSDQTGILRLQNRPIWDSAFNKLSGEQTKESEKQTNCNYVEVPVVSLDHALANYTQPVHFLKCDVEGFEMAVLRGAHKLLSNNAPILVLEADMPSAEGRASKRAFELATYLKHYGYQACSFDFDGSFQIGILDSFPVHHANIAFIPEHRTDVLKAVD